METILVSKLVQIYDHFDERFSRIVYFFDFFGLLSCNDHCFVACGPASFFSAKIFGKVFR